MITTDFRLQMEGYGLTTAEIHYHLPDHPSLLQLYVWQDYDLAPAFPELRGFLDYWTEMQIPREVAPRFRDDVAPSFRDLTAP